MHQLRVCFEYVANKNICVVQNAPWGTPSWVIHLFNCILETILELVCTLACMHACQWVTRAGRAGRAGHNGDLAIIFHHNPLEVARDGTCTVLIAPSPNIISRYTAGMHLCRRLTRLVWPSDVGQAISVD